MLLFLFLAMGIVFVMISQLVAFLQTGVPFVRTRSADIPEILAVVPLRSTDVVYDLGSGDGSVCFALEKSSGCAAVGFELAWWTVALARLKKVFLKSHVQFRRENFFSSPWQEATVVYAYLYPPLMARVAEKFSRECRPGTRAVVRDFPFPDTAASRVVQMPGNHELYVYVR